ncbi:MAG: hypothetical protein U0136_05260 [Bdellovibrionota bacterium]
MQSIAGMQESYLGPRHPALNRVMLVESRFGVRADVIRALKASLLFEEIVEAKSLSDGLMKLYSDEFDACIIGASVNRVRAKDFVTRAVQASKGKDCAFIALVSEPDESVVLADTEKFFHAEVQWPCSRRTLKDGIVLAVSNANSESGCKGIFIPSTLPPQPTAVEETPSSPEQISGRFQHAMSTFMAGGLADLSFIVEGVERGDFGLDAERRPPVAIRTIIEDVVEKLFPPELQSRRMRAFKEYFLAALLLWYVDLVSYTPEIARNNLRSSLISYTKEHH